MSSGESIKTNDGQRETGRQRTAREMTEVEGGEMVGREKEKGGEKEGGDREKEGGVREKRGEGGEKAPPLNVRMRKRGGLNQIQRFIKRRSQRWEGEEESVRREVGSVGSVGSSIGRGGTQDAVTSQWVSQCHRLSTDSLSSVSSRESCEERDAAAILSRQLSRKSIRGSVSNPIQDNVTLRLLLLFLSTLLGFLLRLLLLLWTHVTSFFTDGEPDTVTSEDEQPLHLNKSQHLNKAQHLNNTHQHDISIIHPVRKMDYCHGQQGRERVFYICNELTFTEEAYVERLAILVMAKERSAKIVGAALAGQMFKDIEVIYSFHKDNLLPELKTRMAKWDEFGKVGDVMRKLTPFLKLYTEYVKDFQRALALVDSWENKNSAFAAMIRDIRDNQAERHGKLKVQAHMMEPIQRVPRYELLLRDYLQRLPDNSPDQHDTEEALVSVARSASHFEEMMKRDSRIARLIEVRDRLDSSFMNIVIPNRELVSEHKLNVLSASSGKVNEKQAFLFNDLLLICSRQKIQKKFKVKTSVDLREAEVSRGTNLDIPFTLTVHTPDSFVDLVFSSEVEEIKWREILQSLVDAFTRTQARGATSSSIGSTDSCDSGVMSHGGHVQVSCDDGRSWKHRWLTLTESGKLKAYKTEEDSSAISWVRVEKFSVVTAVVGRKTPAISLEAFNRRYLLRCDDETNLNGWYDVLQAFQPTSSPHFSADHDTAPVDR